MINILVAVFIYAVVFLADYLFYVKRPASYRYTSLLNFFLFVGGQITLFLVFFDTLKPFFLHYKSEFFYLACLLVASLVFSRELIKDKLFVCHLTSRTERCLTPSYVAVKGMEIGFQQLTYLVIALSLVKILGFNILAFIAFIQILLIMHTPIIISCNKQVVSRLTFGIGVLAAPILYIFIEIGYFFPAVYLHALMYVFYWVTFADFQAENTLNVDKTVD